MKITLEIETTEIETIGEAQKLLNSLLPTEVKVVERPTEGKPKRGRKPKEVKEVEAPAEEVKEAPSVSLEELKILARSKAQSVGRVEVKDTIAKYGTKLSDVKEADYNSLAEDLKSL